VQEATQLPETQKGALGERQSAFEVHTELDGVGSQTPFVQVNPAAQGVEALQEATHWPSAQVFPSAHWLVYSHTAVGASQAPATHCSPFAQLALLVQAQGPPVAVPHGPRTMPVSGLPVSGLPESALPVSGFEPESFFGSTKLTSAPASIWFFGIGEQP
jgi:hypothetical protein